MINHSEWEYENQDYLKEHYEKRLKNNSSTYQLPYCLYSLPYIQNFACKVTYFPSDNTPNTS